MRRLILGMTMTLDGFVAGPNGETDWRFRGGDEGGKRFIEESLWQVGLHAMGRVSYEAMAPYWPGSSDSLAAPMNAIPKAVFTRRSSLDLSSYPDSWGAAEVVTGDLATELARLKRAPGKDILVHGGVRFAQSVAASGLVDEFRFFVHPVALGQGQSIFAQLAKPLELELRNTTLFRSGVAAQVYFPA
jgi:dihydrofolate reductase